MVKYLVPYRLPLVYSLPISSLWYRYRLFHFLLDMYLPMWLSIHFSSLQRVALREMVQNLRMSNLSNFSAMIYRSVNPLMQQPLFSTSREI